MTGYRHYTNSRSAPSLEWEGLPVVGADRRAPGKNDWRWRHVLLPIVGVAAFWGGVFFALWNWR